MRVSCFAVSALLGGIASTALAQTVHRPIPAAAERHVATRAAAPVPRSPNGIGAFAIEALGGSAGSLAGILIVAKAHECASNDDLACTITKVGAAGAVGVVGATVGTTLAARHTGSKRSVVGAALGGIVGTGAGLGVHWLLNRQSDRNLGDDIVVPIFVLSQGTFAAAGSRLLGR